MSDTPTTPAGWYPDPTAPGTERYWDGTAWTDHSRPVAVTPSAPPPLPPTPDSSPAPVGSVVASGKKPDNSLVWTILATVLCCLPIGAVGIYFSTQVDKLWAEGDVVGAESRSRSARTLAIVAAVVTLVGLVGWVVFLALFGEWNVEVNP
jgi:hypothetical protein